MDDSTAVAYAAVGVSLVWVLTHWTRRYLETKHPLPGLGVPMADNSHWLFGHIFVALQPDFRKKVEWIKSFANENGQVAVWIVSRPTLYVFDWQDAKTILNMEHSRHRSSFVSRHVAKVTGERGLLALNGKDWRYHRLAVSRTFNPDFLNGARKDMKEVTEVMVAIIQNKILSSDEESLNLNIEPLMKNITVDVFGKTALNVDLKSCNEGLAASPLSEAFEYLILQLMKRIRSPFKPHHFFYWLPTEMNRRQKKERNLIRSFLADLIEKKRKQRDNGVTESKDLLSHLLQAHSDVQDMEIASTKNVTDDNLTDIVMSLFVAGFDTTSTTLACALYLLAQNPEMQDYCVKEIQAVKGDLSNPEDLVYCKAVIWETLRMYPPAVGTLRTLSKPVTIGGGVVVPKGTNVTIPIYSIHHDETLFPKPNDFLPGRWVARDSEGKWKERSTDDKTGNIAVGNRQAMFAFSSGGRNCVGIKFATQEAVIVLANLLNGLQFESVSGFTLKTSTKSFLHKPDNGVVLNVRIRQRKSSEN